MTTPEGLFCPYCTFLTAFLLSWGVTHPKHNGSFRLLMFSGVLFFTTSLHFSKSQQDFVLHKLFTKSSWVRRSGVILQTPLHHLDRWSVMYTSWDDPWCTLRPTLLMIRDVHFVQPVNTVWDIEITDEVHGTHWLLTELDLVSKDLYLWNWIDTPMTKTQKVYESLAGQHALPNCQCTLHLLIRAFWNVVSSTTPLLTVFKVSHARTVTCTSVISILLPCPSQNDNDKRFPTVVEGVIVFDVDLTW